ncbi:TPA_asm: maturation protein [ssRNA phage SRR6960802_4]|uniref:Maturation protein n=1 Tax=ssRNA phage SRR6960802_4 TaxID=2786610 RepID=A0A8S5KZA6_9VIRU|nr:maturation protein [ssRNA phage SRR6960802_4]DAD51054.1 TPA_asm: maturation protein [ssRNA phage SRR6960802_4]
MDHPPKSKILNSSELEQMTWAYSDGWKAHSHTPNFRRNRMVQYTEGELQRSQGNPYYLLGSSSEAIGGDFRVRSRKYSEYSSLSSGGPVHFSWSEDPMDNGSHHYYMLQNAVTSDVTDESPQWPLAVPSSFDALSALGTTAIARCIPTNPVFNAAAFLGEAREGMPSTNIETWKGRTLSAKGAGKDYLNYQFGWKPLVGDIHKFCRAVKDHNKIIDKFIADSGKLLHKSYHFPTVSSYNISQSSGFPLPKPIVSVGIFDFESGNWKLTTRTSSVRRRWFSGAFTYVIPNEDGVLGDYGRGEAIANKLLGIRLTPEVLWELTPWSWAVDWFSNAGDIARNVSAFANDGLVMPYAYMMEHLTVTKEYQLSGVRYKSYPGTQTFRQTFTTEVKSRRVATPFGFGVSIPDLTLRQKSIIAALAVSRSGKSGSSYKN